MANEMEKFVRAQRTRLRREISLIESGALRVVVNGEDGTDERKEVAQAELDHINLILGPLSHA